VHDRCRAGTRSDRKGLDAESSDVALVRVTVLVGLEVALVPGDAERRVGQLRAPAFTRQPAVTDPADRTSENAVSWLDGFAVLVAATALAPPITTAASPTSAPAFVFESFISTSESYGGAPTNSTLAGGTGRPPRTVLTNFARTESPVRCVLRTQVVGSAGQMPRRVT
jgi:hypothetical protein